MKMMKKAVVAVAFLGLVAMPMAAMATDSCPTCGTSPATTGTATNTANYDIGVVYQNSTATIDTNTQSLSVATDPQQGFSVDASGHTNSGTVYNDSTSGGAVFGALGGYTKSSSSGGGGFIDNDKSWFGNDISWGGGHHSDSSFLGGFIAGGYYQTNQNGFGDTWSSFSDHLCITGSLNAIYSQTWENAVVNTQMAAVMGSADLTSATSATAAAGDGSLAGSLDLAHQQVSQGGGGQFAVGGGTAGLYANPAPSGTGGVAGLNIGGGYASGGGGSHYTGSTFSGSIAGQN